MTLETFFEKFDQIADSPNALERIRRLVLDAAVKGMLVEQDPNDESASSLIARIHNEREHLENKGEIKKRAHLAPIELLPYKLPTGWAWTRLGNTGRIFNGTSVSESEKIVLSKVAEGFPFIATKDVGYGRGRLAYENGLKVPFDASSYKVARAEAVLICAEGGSAGKKVGQTDRDVCFGNKLYANEVWPGIDPRYILSVYQSTGFFNEFAAKMTGIIGGIARSEFLLLPVPIPPENEQKRIVAKVDELMALCDRLEEQQQERETRHAALARASLARFADAPTPENLNFLFHDSYTIAPADLRKAILTLAIRGKLVSQDPNDQSATTLLQTIHAERLVAIKARRVSPVKALPPVELDELAYDLRSGWALARLCELVMDIQTGPFGSSLHKSDYKLGGTPVINPASLRDGKIEAIEAMAIGPDTLKRLQVFKLTAGDIVMARRGEMGRCAVVTKREEGWLCGTGSLVLRMPNSLYAPYLAMLIGAPEAREYLGGASVGATMQNLNQSILARMPVGLPPLAEQRRIVAKVDQLMVLVDQLETQLAASRATAVNLMEAVVA